MSYGQYKTNHTIFSMDINALKGKTNKKNKNKENCLQGINIKTSNISQTYTQLYIHYVFVQQSEYSLDIIQHVRQKA